MLKLKHCCHHCSGCANNMEQAFCGKVGFPVECGGEQLWKSQCLGPGRCWRVVDRRVTQNTVGWFRHERTCSSSQGDKRGYLSVRQACGQMLGEVSSDCRGGRLGWLGWIVGYCSGLWEEDYGLQMLSSDESPWEGSNPISCVMQLPYSPQCMITSCGRELFLEPRLDVNKILLLREISKFSRMLNIVHVQLGLLVNFDFDFVQ